MKRNLQLVSCLLAFIVVVTGCKKNPHDNVIPDPTGGKACFVSASAAGSYTSTQLKAFAVIKGFQNYVPLIQFDVDFYKIIYNTTYNGQQIQASGLLGIPKNVPVTPALLSAQHGTIFNAMDAPSNFPLAFTGFELFASTGFITAIPDYIGYGVSKNIVHPYYDMKYSGLAVVDMLKAVQYYLTTIKQPVSNKLFLVGYSEGGYVSLAAQKEIETNKTHHITLTAAAEGAGGYDLTGMLSQIALVPTYPDPSFLAFIIQAYNTTYKWNRPLTDFFMEPYASKIPQLLNGTKNTVQINSELNTAPSQLFSSAFYSSLTNPAAETTLKAQLAANSFPGWFPVSPTRLYHGTADEDVFYQTTQTTYNRFIAAGAPHLEFITIPNGTHETSVEPMMLNALPWIKSLAQ